MSTKAHGYNRVELADAREGDEVLHAGEWVPIKSAREFAISGGRKFITVTYANDGGETFPASHGISIRRAVEATTCAGCGTTIETHGYADVCDKCAATGTALPVIKSRDGIEITEVDPATAKQGTINADGTTSADDYAARMDRETISYRVKHSKRLSSWYIVDNVGECVSGLYDTEAEATAALTAGEW
jgi:hypothetical protein